MSRKECFSLESITSFRISATSKSAVEFFPSKGRYRLHSSPISRSCNSIVPAAEPTIRPGTLFTPPPKAAKRVLEFFTAQINNDHTRKAYLNATRRFAEWCDARPDDEALRPRENNSQSRLVY